MSSEALVAAAAVSRPRAVDSHGATLVSARLSPTDWCDAGLSLLRDEGMPALTIERLCEALGRTKGSFYHHFRDLSAFLAMLLSRWEETLTAQPIELAAAEANPRKRAARLDVAVANLDHRLDLAVRAWGLWDGRARAAIARVDARRLAYLTEVYTAGGIDRAKELAQLEYVAFVGAQQLGASVGPERAARLRADVQRALAFARRQRSGRTQALQSRALASKTKA